MVLEAAELPNVIVPGRRPKYDDVEFVGVEIVEDGPSYYILLVDGSTIGPGQFFQWLLGKEVYVSNEYQGHFDKIFKYLPPVSLKFLATAGIAWYKNITIELRGRGGHFSVREGNRWGHFSNIYSLYPGAKTAKQVELALDLANVVFESNEFFSMKFRSVGSSIQDVAAQLPGSRYQPRGEWEVMDAFLQSFRAARMEGIIFGTSEVYDYDIISAYPALCAKLVSTLHMEWIESDKPVENASYAAVMADIHLNERLVRGPIAVPVGYKGGSWYPVGRISNVWLNMPEIEFLQRHPEVGTIEKIHNGYWGVAISKSFYPFRRLVKKLYAMRIKNPEIGDYIKLVMAALWGKTIGQYVVIRDPITGEGHTQASNLYNPVFASQVTSMMRMELYEKSMGASVVGEFVDGVTSEDKLSAASSFKHMGAMALKGEGTFTLFNDIRKTCPWKNPDLRDRAWEQRDKYTIETPLTYFHTLKSAYDRFGENEMWVHLGVEKEQQDIIKLGSVTRSFIGNKKYRVGDFLEEQIRTAPMTSRQMLYELYTFVR
ncbi:hypothetical protein LCGC14_0381510 [marine sediment metagenome]|uniref:Uncharacterized protein n=1 Tax=marine sediment metagenome TaxID=412755 RepID=A0A0F9T814_9ZZZZ